MTPAVYGPGITAIDKKSVSIDELHNATFKVIREGYLNIAALHPAGGSIPDTSDVISCRWMNENFTDTTETSIAQSASARMYRHTLLLM